MKFLTIRFINSYLKRELDIVKLKTKESLKKGTKIIVEKNADLKLAEIYSINEISNISDIPQNVCNFIRTATKRDLQQQEKNEKESEEVYSYAQKKANELNLDMHFVDSFYTFDRKQLFISYVADTRVDFRELTKILAQKYRTRIELRQIGVRDKAQKIGGIGPCGLFLCCNTFLTDFVSVSIGMAKNQFLALNPTKINGVCGRLLCCLKYEDEAYTSLKEKFPEVGNIINNGKVEGKVVEINILSGTYKIETKSKEIVELKND